MCALFFVVFEQWTPFLFSLSLYSRTFEYLSAAYMPFGLISNYNNRHTKTYIFTWIHKSSTSLSDVSDARFDCHTSNKIWLHCMLETNNGEHLMHRYNSWPIHYRHGDGFRSFRIRCKTENNSRKTALISLLCHFQIRLCVCTVLYCIVLCAHLTCCGF